MCIYKHQSCRDPLCSRGVVIVTGYCDEYVRDLVDGSRNTPCPAQEDNVGPREYFSSEEYCLACQRRVQAFQPLAAARADDVAENSVESEGQTMARENDRNEVGQVIGNVELQNPPLLPVQGNQEDILNQFINDLIRSEPLALGIFEQNPPIAPMVPNGQPVTSRRSVARETGSTAGDTEEDFERMEIVITRTRSRLVDGTRMITLAEEKMFQDTRAWKRE